MPAPEVPTAAVPQPEPAATPVVATPAVPGFPSPPEEGLALYLGNLVALLTTGVLASAWVLFATDWFPALGGLLGLGGLFAWVAFVSGLLSKERKEQMQLAFERRVLLRRATRVRCALALLALAALWACATTLVLDASADDSDRMVEVRPGGDAQAAYGEPLHRELIPARSSRKLLLFSLPWSAPVYRVKPAGLPGLCVRLRRFARTPVRMPRSFADQPFLLVRPTPALSATLAAAASTYELIASLPGRPDEILTSYGGETVWVGAEADVPIPEGLRERWRRELVGLAALSAESGGQHAASGLVGVEPALALWLAPRSVFSGAGPRVCAGPAGRGPRGCETLTVRVRRVGETSEFCQASRTLAPAEHGGTVQELRLEP